MGGADVESVVPPVPVVHLVLIGRTLRGTLGEAFRAEAVARVVGTADPAGGADAGITTALSRTVELTAVVVSTAGDVRVTASIADPAFPGGGVAPPPLAPGHHRFSVAVDGLEGIRPLTGPPDADLTRTVTVDVRSAERPRLSVGVVERD